MTALSPIRDTYLAEKMRYLRFLEDRRTQRSGEHEPIRTTPIFSLAVKYAVDGAPPQYIDISDDEADTTPSSAGAEGQNDVTNRTTLATLDADQKHSTSRETPLLPQYGLLGFEIDEIDKLKPPEPIMINVHAPNSVFICGSQGSGKSYTLACLLESFLLPDSRFGRLQQPVAGLVFHYDSESSGAIAEVVHLASRGVRVNVLVSSSNFEATQDRYRAATQGVTNITVEKFLLPPSELSVERMHRLMAFSEKSDSVPLYMEVIQRILRQMAISGRSRGFNYGEFLNHLDAASLTADQQRPMKLRLDLLQSFMRWPPTKSDLKKKAPQGLLSLQPGNLTIVDLSDPFLDDATVCMLFDICLSIAKERRPRCGLVVALDEAHKYMNQSPAAANFTDRLLTTIREQRHIGIRVVISTQEPTISEKLLDLCSVSIVHQFKSPAWFQAIRAHLGGASGFLNTIDEQASMFEEIMGLAIGESKVFAPEAFIHLSDNNQPLRLRTGVLRMKTRRRIGVDGGVSVMVGETNGHAQQLFE
ncbi:hypothetical protein D6C78_08104 [Aureobasidium pullulans]|uniref:AAA+ ATPase domain-containing protein n=1 Tax=Aureobasidium pullulans TaxID=5580 RepID=A0A4T0BEB9_AURPU|nr:hypothetical protein D6C78_08104 [Aureobasidium pullulans]